MKITYLGTAAAEGMPASFCDCELCRHCRVLGGKDIRTRSQALIDDCLLIDFPADTYMHVLYHGLELHRIEHCLITHSHFDHLYPGELRMRAIEYAHGIAPQMTFYATKPAYDRIIDAIVGTKVERDDRVRAVKIGEKYVPFEAAGYRIIPLKANHGQHIDPVFYAVSDGEKWLLYAHDTGYFPDDTWAYLASTGFRFDAVSLDCTMYRLPTRDNHMGLPCCVDVRDRLKEIGVADENTVFVLNHFSHNHAALHAEMEETARLEGFLVSYDGMVLEF